MIRLKDVVNALESFAPLSLQESYDNAGLYCGDEYTVIQAVLLTLDITEEVIEEAIARNCQLIVAHHPVIFKPLRRLTGNTFVERVMVKAIQNGIALYAAHTNLDNVALGVNFKLAQKIGLSDVKILEPKKGMLRQLTVFVPDDHVTGLLSALAAAGAGQTGNYADCSFSSRGTGRFTPGEQAVPVIGQTGKAEEVSETRIEVLVSQTNEQEVLAAMRNAHPYEEIAYFLTEIRNHDQETGAGAIGFLPEPMPSHLFLSHLAGSLNLEQIRFTDFDKPVHKVAVCGGVGSFLLQKAIHSGAQAFVSADFKYHEFFEAERRLMIADVGHYESEISTKELFHEVLTKKIPNIAVLFSTVNTNPVKYYSSLHGNYCIPKA